MSRVDMIFACDQLACHDCGEGFADCTAMTTVSTSKTKSTFMSRGPPRSWSSPSDLERESAGVMGDGADSDKEDEEEDEGCDDCQWSDGMDEKNKACLAASPSLLSPSSSSSAGSSKADGKAGKVAKASKATKAADGGGYQVFRICRERCQQLQVTVRRGLGITRGRFKDWLYSPDPYVSVRLLGTANGVKKTRHIPNSSDPVWNETLIFYADVKKDYLLEFVLFDLNSLVANEEVGREIVDVRAFQADVDHPVEVTFNNGSKVEATVRLEKNPLPNLRLDLSLCREEASFRDQRRAHVWRALRELLGEARAPEENSQVPTMCLMTSGGGFRATIANAGAFKALSHLGIVDCITYVAALSGSSWYLSTLYSHPDFPGDPNVTAKILPEMRSCVEKHWQVHLSPPWSSRYIRKIIGKSMNGQPVSFTDFYGYLVGQQLLKGRMKTRLSDQRDKICAGQAPMPIYTCLHVKSNVSAKVFQEWYEFTPFEACVPKYGLSMPVQDFAAKFYAGQKIKDFSEVPLHFLWGIWGSAFTILFKRLVQEKGRRREREVLDLIFGGGGRGRRQVEEEEQFVSRLAQECADESVHLSHGTASTADLKCLFDDPIPLLRNSNGPTTPLSAVSFSSSTLFHRSHSTDDDKEEKEGPTPLSSSLLRLPTSLTSPENLSSFCHGNAHTYNRNQLSAEEESPPYFSVSTTSSSGVSSGADDSIDDSNVEAGPLRFSGSSETAISATKLSRSKALRQKLKRCGDLSLLQRKKKSWIGKSFTLEEEADEDVEKEVTTTSSSSSCSPYDTVMSASAVVVEEKKVKETRGILEQKNSDPIDPILPRLAVSSSKTHDYREGEEDNEDDEDDEEDETGATQQQQQQQQQPSSSRWDRVLERALLATPIDSRAFRAGVIFNPLRGLEIEENSAKTDENLQSAATKTDETQQQKQQQQQQQVHIPPMSPVKPTDNNDCDFKGYREPSKTDEKKIYLVDSGLSFNLPFPLMLRPQRRIELYITFDFSSRKSDVSPPFRELLLAEKWARLHKVPFPRIQKAVKESVGKPFRECYVFKGEDDVDDDAEDVPVVIYFPLINLDFRNFKSPGVPRKTAEEKEFGNFDLFGKTTAFASWRFVYPGVSFDQLTSLVEFNVWNNMDVVKREIAELIQKKKRRAKKRGEKE